MEGEIVRMGCRCCEIPYAVLLRWIKGAISCCLLTAKGFGGRKDMGISRIFGV